MLKNFKYSVIFLFGIIAFTLNLAALEKSALIERPEIKVGFLNQKGQDEFDSSGKRVGYGFDYLQRITSYADFKNKYIGFAASREEMCEYLKSGKIDLLVFVKKTPENQAHFDFSKTAIAHGSIILSITADNTKLAAGDFKNWDGIKIGMLKGYEGNKIFENFAHKNGFKFTPVYYAEMPEMLEALHSKNEIEALVSSNLRKLSGEKILLSIGDEPFYLAVKKGNSKLLKSIDSALEKIDLETPDFADKLLAKHYPNNNCILALSPAERDFIKQCKGKNIKFKALLNPDRHPYSFFQNGKATGIIGELVSDIIAQSGLPIEIEEVKNRKEWMKLVDKKAANYLIADTWNNRAIAEELNYYLSEPYISIPVSRLHRKEFNGTRENLASLVGSYFMMFLIPDCERLKPIFFDSVSEAVNAVKKGNADTLYIFTAAAEKIKQKDYENLLVFETVPSISAEMVFAIPSQIDPRVTSILNKSIQALPAEKTMQIIAKYTKFNNTELTVKGLIFSNVFLVLMSAAMLLGLAALLLFFLILRSNAKYKTADIFKNLPLHYFVSDAAGNVLCYGLGKENKYDKHNGKCKTLLDLPDEKLNSMMLEHICEVIKTGTNNIVNFDCGAQKRSAFVCKLPFHIFKRECAIWISQDETALQQAREKAEYKTKLLEQALDKTAAYIAVKDLSDGFKYIFWNKAASDFFGVDSNEFIGKTDSEIDALKGDAEAFRKEDCAVLNGENIDMVKTLVNAQGENRKLRIIANGADLPDGKKIEVILAVDVTDLKNLECEREKNISKLKEYAEKANSASHEKNLFLSAMSHEIRTPLNAVIAFSEILQDENVPLEKQTEYLKSINKAGYSLLNLINDILELSRLETKENQTDIKPTNLSAIADEIESLFKTSLKEKGVAFEKIISDNLPILMLDKRMVRQVLFNLVGNSAKFTDKGFVSLRIQCEKSEEGKAKLTIKVEDTGEGIREEEQSELFKTFVRDNSTRDIHNQNDTGLGLPIVNKLVEQMNAKMEFKSETQKGSVFTIIFDDVTVVKDNFVNGKPEMTKNALNGEKLILAVDDIETNREIFAAICRKLKLPCITASSAKEAFEIMKSHKPTHILTDIWMPEINGVELARMVRKNDELKDIEIFAVTADKDAQENFSTTDLDGIILKPVTPKKIADILKLTQPPNIF